MTVSELIEKLERFRDKHGDLPVVIERTEVDYEDWCSYMDDDFDAEKDNGDKVYGRSPGLAPDNPCPDGPWCFLH